MRPLHYDNHTLQLPDFILKEAAADRTDGTRKPVAMYVYGVSVSPIQKHGLEADDRRWVEQEDMDYWQWDAAQQPQPPALPSAAAGAPVRAKGLKAANPGS